MRRALCTFVSGIVLLVIFLAPTPRATAAAQVGLLDQSFGGGDGMVTTGFASPTGDPISARAAGVVVQPDGKIVVAGTKASSFVVVRYGIDGTLDPSFGTGGRVGIWFAGDPLAEGLALQPDGRIVVVGTARDYSAFAVARIDPDGTLDGTFGKGGKVATLLPDSYWSEARGVVIQPDGKIVVAGINYFDNQPAVEVVRYGSDGTLDPTFGTGGIFADVTRCPGHGNAVAIQPDGKIVVAGDRQVHPRKHVYHYRFLIARFTTDGVLDPSFSGDGKLLTGFGPSYANNYQGATAIAVQPDGRIVAAGYAHAPYDSVFAMARYLPDGTIDGTFGTDGRVETRDRGPEGFQLSATSMKLDAGGEIVLAGGATLGVPVFEWAWATARYSLNGRPDHSFSGDGIVLTGWPDTSKPQGPAGVALAPGGAVVAAGDASSGVQDLALLRYAPPQFRPDAKVRARVAPLTGDDAYFADPRKQTVWLPYWRRTMTGRLLIENDGTSIDRFIVGGTGSNDRYLVHYSVGDRRVTRAVVLGTYRTPLLAPGATYVMKVTFIARPDTRIGAKIVTVLSVHSVSASASADAVRLIYQLTTRGCSADGTRLLCE